MTNSEECIIWYIQTRLAWQSSTWNPCGRVQMEQSGTSWMVSLFDHFLIDNLLQMDLCIAHGPWYFSFTAGTVFREPILCKNVPRLVPGTYNSYLIVFIFSNFFFMVSLIYINWLFHQAGPNPYALEDMLLEINTGQLMQLSKDLGSWNWCLVILVYWLCLREWLMIIGHPAS